jgi:hypothetical protein
MNVGRFKKSGKKEQKEFSIAELRKALKTYADKKNIGPGSIRTIGRYANKNTSKGES